MGPDMKKGIQEDQHGLQKEGNFKNLCFEELVVLAGGMEACPSGGSKNMIYL
jgi:hypothetical protein